MSEALYQHTDSQICDSIRERLTQTRDIDARLVRVGVSKGKVLLEGSVPDGAMQKAIEDLVDVCPGVQDIENRIQVSS
jgi:osmotically-inducible protein OsmY